MKKQQIIIGLLILFVLINLTSCAPENLTTKEYGFFSGLVHGFLLVFTLIGKLFGAHIGIYAVHNTGFFYYLGFLIGLGAFGGGGGAASRRKY